MESSLLFLKELLLALLLGGFMGLEREKKHSLRSDHEFGGIRTLMLASTLGFLVQHFFPEESPLFLLFTAGFLLLVGASHVLSSWIHKSAGATTEMAGIFAYLIGILVGKGNLFAGALVALVVILTLYFKEALHHFAHRINKNELYDGLKFLTASLIIWPLLPNQTIDPWGVLNPYQIWLILLLISGISFISYLAMKALGTKKGVGWSGFLGGLISSTAVTFSLAHLSRKIHTSTYPFVVGILLASITMLLRVLVTLSVFGGELLPLIKEPIGAMILSGSLLAFYFYIKSKGEGDFKKALPMLKSPFQIGSALKFTLLLAAMLLITHWTAQELGEQGIYAAAFISGILDVDAVTMSMAKLAKIGDLSPTAAALSVVIVVMSNTLSKGVLALIFASPKVGFKVLGASFCMILAGALTQIA